MKNYSTNTIWVVTSEGRKQTYSSEEELNKYINKTRPANDEFFSIEKITTEKYQIDSKIDKVTIDKQMMLDVVHHLVKTIKTSKFPFNVIDYSHGMIYDLSKYGDFEYDVCNYNYKESTKCLIDILSNATIDDIDESFVYNQCDLKGCHNYFIRFANAAYRESEKLFKCYNGETYEERCKIWDEAKEYKRKNKAISFGIQFRTQGNGDIVFCGPYDYCYGRKTRCVSTKKMPFGETEKNKFIEFIDKIFKKNS